MNTDQKYGLVRDFTTLSQRAVKKPPLKKSTPYRREAAFSSDELATEEWRPVPQHEARWLISSLGQIKNASPLSKYCKPNKPILATRLGSDGYEQFCSSFIDENRKRRSVHLRIHRMVALAFLPNPQKLPLVHHKDNNKLNNRLSNLAWLTIQQNVAYALEQVPGRREVLKKLHKYSPIANPQLRLKS